MPWCPPAAPEEIFGPVVTVITVDSDDEAVKIANDTDLGLTAGVITESATRGFAVARRLRTGIVHVNNQTVDDEPQAPFGGVKSSGYGQFGGRWQSTPSPTPAGSPWPASKGTSPSSRS